MNIFKEVKERITARQVAERYGLKVSRNGMACCPFHNDKHPSMKIEQNYYCFACGAKGDAVNYVAVLSGLSPFEAAKKINEDFSLDIPIGQTEVRRKQKSEIKKKRRLRQKKNGFNSSRRRLTDGQRRLQMYCFGISGGWNSGRSFTSRNLWKPNGIRYLLKLCRMKVRSVIWWTF